MTTTTIKVPLRERLNLRVLMFAAVALLVIGYPIYVFVETSVTGGIRQRGEYYEVDLKSMSSFEMDQTAGTIDSVPKQYRELDGKKVILEGEMWEPMGAEDKARQFQLVYSISKCCMSGTPKVQHFIHSKAVDPKGVPYYDNLVRVYGTLHVNVKHDAGKVASVFQFDVEKVEPK